MPYSMITEEKHPIRALFFRDHEMREKRLLAVGQIARSPEH